MEDLSNYLTLTEAARKLDVSRQWVHVLIKTGRLPATRHGGRWLIHVEDLEASHAQKQVLR